MSGLRIGVIGAGAIGARHVSVLASDQRSFALVAIADPLAKAEGLLR